ncbi:MAG: double zinc ribbon domain-containing protein [Armatimonadota bacterium]
MKCRNCGRAAQQGELVCKRCGSALVNTDQRLCPYCGKLRDPFFEICPECEGAYVPPEMRTPVIPELPPEEPKGRCANCGNPRPINDKPCPWCNSKLLVLPME